MNDLISVILATYNRKPLLQKTLLGLEHQQCKNFEVIVGCDGSTDQTKTLVLSLKEKVNFPLRFIEQEDLGFRKSLILNKAILIAQGQQLIFLDDDCVPNPGFVRGHQKKFSEQTLILGKFIGVRQQYQFLFDLENIHNGCYERCFTWREKIDLFYWQLKYRAWIAQKHPSRPKLNGCNFSVCRASLLAVNGFDLAFTGWGFEDNDLRRRLLASGVKLKEAVLATRVYNLATDKFSAQTGVTSTVQTADPAQLKKNRLMASSTARPFRCEQGLDSIDREQIEVY